MSFYLTETALKTLADGSAVLGRQRIPAARVLDAFQAQEPRVLSGWLKHPILSIEVYEEPAAVTTTTTTTAAAAPSDGNATNNGGGSGINGTVGAASGTGLSNVTLGFIGAFVAVTLIVVVIGILYARGRIAESSAARAKSPGGGAEGVAGGDWLNRVQSTEQDAALALHVLPGGEDGWGGGAG